MSVQAPRISLVIPCRNEAARLPASLGLLRAFLDQASEPIEVLIVVEKGDDGTAEMAQKAAADDPRIRVICNPQARGKGFAVKTGMLAAAGRAVFFMDADMSVPLRYVTEFLPFLDEADIVIGNRRHRESRIPRPQPPMRIVFGRIFNVALRSLGITTFSDTQCGFKAFRREAAQAIFSRLKLDGFTFDVEALALAEILGYRVIDRPVEWSDSAGTKLRAVRHGTGGFFEAVLAVWRLRKDNRRPSL